MRRTRVGMVSFSELAVGGIETHLLQIFRGLQQEFEFLTIGTLGEPFRSEAEALGVECVQLPAAGKADLAAVLGLREAFRARHVDIVHSHDTRGGLLGRLAARLSSLRAVHTVHTPSFFLPSNPHSASAYRLAEGFLNRFASDRVIFVSRTIQQSYLSGRLVPPAKARFIPNGLEPEWFTYSPRKPSGYSGLTFVYIGRLSPEKGLDTLGEAFSLVSKQRSDIRLRVIGAGTEGGPLLQLARDGGWASRLEMAGKMPREKARDALREDNTVFVLPSRFESMSYTLLEAMACGLPAIAADVGGNCDLVDPGSTGLLVPPRNPGALAEAMFYLVDHPDARDEFGRAGRKKAERYTLGSMIDGLRRVYQELIPQ